MWILSIYWTYRTSRCISEYFKIKELIPTSQCILTKANHNLPTYFWIQSNLLSAVNSLDLDKYSCPRATLWAASSLKGKRFFWDAVSVLLRERPYLDHIKWHQVPTLWRNQHFPYKFSPRTTFPNRRRMCSIQIMISLLWFYVFFYWINQFLIFTFPFGYHSAIWAIYAMGGRYHEKY